MTTDIITDTDAPLATAVEAEATKLVRDAFARLQLQAKKIANGESLDEDDRARLLTEAAEVLRGTRKGITPGTTPTLALGAGTPTPIGTPVINNLEQAIKAYATQITHGDTSQLIAVLLAVMDGLATVTDDADRNSRVLGVQNVSNGDVPVDRTGNVDHSAAVAVVQAELDAERDPMNFGSLAYKLAAGDSQIRTLTTERDVERARVTRRDATITGAENQWTADMASLKTLVDADRSLKGRLARNKDRLRPDVQTALGL